jgi:Ca2+-binding RTX toxin-like protein
VATLVAAVGLPPATQAGEEVPRCRGEAATVIGTPGHDVFTDGSEATSESDIELDSGDVVVARGGRDSISGQNVSGVLACGNGGRDHLTASGRAGRDLTFVGGTGADWLGDDAPSPAQGPVSTRLTLIGGYGNDAVLGGAKADQILGQAGADEIYGGGGRDDVFGGPSDDLIGGGSGNDTLEGNQGGDRLKGDRGKDSALGGAGRDHCEAERKRRCES